MNIYYIGYYDFQDSSIPRKYIVSAVNKMTYISRVLLRLSSSFMIVSLALPTGNRFYYRSRTVTENGIKAHFFPFIGIIKRERIKDIWRSCFLFCYGLFHFKRGDVIVSYHSTSYASHILAVLRRIKHFKLILEVEEVYSSLLSSDNEVLKIEKESFSNSDGFIFSTDLLAKKINSNNRPFVVIYGTYQADNYNRFLEDDIIHVVYAGTFDSQKGGAAAAAAAAEHLPSNYHVHICGFGNENQTEEIKSIVSKLQNKGCRISFEGLLKGQDYLDMLHRCHIGLSTQDPSAKFNSTSFPSKILSYMASGLAVVSIRIDAVEESKVGKSICYYDNQTPQEIAESIMKCDIAQGENNQEVISLLDKEFQSDMSNCIKALFS